jgi:triosephosphate isomerase
LKKYRNINKVDIVVCPSFLDLWLVGKILVEAKSKIKLGAQNVFWEEKGAFTGEVSPRSLMEVGCQYVIIGHSERRENLWESDQMINQKIRTALKCGLTPIVCVGETFEERKRGQRDSIIERQVSRAFDGITKRDFKKIIVAYEPVWVIGIGQAVEPEDAAYSHHLIRKVLFKSYSPKMVERDLRVVYGGSVNPHNIKSFLGQEGIDGVLVGSASLHLEKLEAMIKNIPTSKKK